MGRSRQKRLPVEPIELTITDLSHDGRGIGRHNDKVVFVHNALPGETVQAKIRKRTRSYDEAEAEHIDNPSQDRVDPACQFYQFCNGCTMMHISDEKQIEFKFNTLKSNLTKMGQITPTQWLSPLSDKHWHYRRRARLSVKWVSGKGKVLVGFREKNGRFVANMSNCLVLEKPLDDLIEPLQELIIKLDIKNHVPQIECAMSDNEVALIMRHMHELSVTDENLLKEFAEKHQLQLFLQSKGPKTIKPLTDDYNPLTFSLSQQQLTYQFKPDDFIQVNRHMNEKMITQVLDQMKLTATSKVLDLFCGLGNFTLPIAQQCQQVVGVEGDGPLVERARQNAQHNSINNAQFYQADLTEDHSKSQWFNNDYSHILIDPPRSGAWEILPLIAATKAETLIYVSCHPASLARDTERLVHELGFQLERAGVMDMFPHTSHVESMAVFSRKVN